LYSAGPNNRLSLADRQTQLEKREREVRQPLLLSRTFISLSTFLQNSIFLSRRESPCFHSAGLNNRLSLADRQTQLEEKR